MPLLAAQHRRRPLHPTATPRAARGLNGLGGVCYRRQPQQRLPHGQPIARQRLPCCPVPHLGLCPDPGPLWHSPDSSPATHRTLNGPRQRRAPGHQRLARRIRHTASTLCLPPAHSPALPCTEHLERGQKTVAQHGQMPTGRPSSHKTEPRKTDPPPDSKNRQRPFILRKYVGARRAAVALHGHRCGLPCPPRPGCPPAGMPPQAGLHCPAPPAPPTTPLQHGLPLAPLSRTPPPPSENTAGGGPLGAGCLRPLPASTQPGGTKAKCLHCVRTACILRTQRLGYSPKNTCHLFTRGKTERCQ